MSGRVVSRLIFAPFEGSHRAGRITGDGGSIMDQKDSVKVIEKLVEICKDGEKGVLRQPGCR
jgi:hypothetical protein